MSDIITLAAAREYLRASSSASETGIAMLLAAAQGRIETFLGRPLLGEGGWASAGEVPPMVAHCVKLALSDFYVNREAPQLTDDQLRPMIGRYMAISFG